MPDTTEAPYTTEAPGTTEVPDTTEAPESWPPSEEPTTTLPPVESSLKTNVFSVFEPLVVQAAAEVETNITVYSSYMDQLSVGEHNVTVSFKTGSASAVVYVEESEKDEELTAEEKTDTKGDTTVATVNSTNNNNTSGNSTGTPTAAQTGDSTPIVFYGIMMILSFAMVWFLGRKVRQNS